MMRSFGMRRRVLSPEEAAANAAARARRQKLAKTCQICGRTILADTGVIAHHGYERPEGMGYQTSSCPGARCLPFENDHKELDRYIEALKNGIELEAQTCGKIVREEIEVRWSYSDHTKPRTRFGYPQVYVGFTRDTFEATREEHKAGFMRNSVMSLNFDYFKRRAIEESNRREAQMQDALDRQQGRRRTWKLTHEWDGIRTGWRKVKP